MKRGFGGSAGAAKEDDDEDDDEEDFEEEEEEETAGASFGFSPSLFSFALARTAAIMRRFFEDILSPLCCFLLFVA